MTHRSETILRSLLSSALIAVALGSPSLALAQAITPGAADVGRVEDRVQGQTQVPASTPDIQVRKAGATVAPAGSENVHFTLSSISFEGATVYSPAQLEKEYANRIGTEISLADLYGIAAQITAKYRNDGYILTQIVVPPQTIEGGVARLQVVEGTIGNITVEGDATKEANALPLMRRYAAGIKKDGGPLNVADLERALLLINDLPGVSARSVISPSPTTVGAADLAIVVTRSPFEGLVGIDNFGSRYLGKWEGTAAGVINSQIFGYNERVTGQVVYAPHGGLFDRELAYGSVAYWAPIGSLGTGVEALYSYTNTKPGLDLRALDVLGKSQYASLTVQHPFIRTRGLNLTGRALFDARSTTTENNIPDEREDHIRALRIGGRLEFIDSLFSGGANTMDLELAKGLNILGASDEDSSRLTRPDGNPQFFKVEGTLERLQHLTSHFNLLLGVKGQYTSSALLSSEEFGVGGSGYGRGYDPSEITGDDGFAAKVEVQWNTPLKSEWFTSPQVFGFYDAGRVWNEDATTSGDKINSLASAGLGLRTDIVNSFKTEVYVARPLTEEVGTENDTDSRFYLNVSRRF